MNILYNTRLWKFAAAAVISAIFFSCEKDKQEELTPLTSPKASLYSSTVSSLTFYWDKIEGASQYAYKLLTTSGEVVDGGVTAGLTATFGGLSDNTTYTFELQAYSPYGGEVYDKSSAISVTGTTPAIVPLPAPVPTVSTEGGITISWAAVAGAGSYAYRYHPAGEPDSAVQGTTESTSVKLSGLDPGDYEFYVSAVSGEEAYSDSEYAKAEFNVEAIELWSVEGTFDDGAGNTWPVTMIAWSNGTYTLKNWYNVEGYDLEFSVNDDTTINILNCYEDYLPNIWAWTGTEWVQLYTTGGYSSFVGNQSEGGYVWFYSYKTAGYAEFTWGAGSPTDALVGTYSQLSTGMQIFDGANWVDFTSDNDVTVAKIDDNTVSVTGLMYEESSLQATFDAEAGTLTFAPQTWLDWYTFCAYESPTTSVVATVSDGTITMSGWTAYYADYSYSYVYNASTTLTKK